MGNPNFNATPIIIQMLLRHTSSIREHNYNIPYNHKISEFFFEGIDIYYKGSYDKKMAQDIFNMKL